MRTCKPCQGARSLTSARFDRLCSRCRARSWTRPSRAERTARDRFWSIKLREAEGNGRPPPTGRSIGKRCESSGVNDHDGVLGLQQFSIPLIAALSLNLEQIGGEFDAARMERTVLEPVLARLDIRFDI